MEMNNDYFWIEMTIHTHKMRPSNIRIKTKGFRAVNEADIVNDGITLVAGENGCGKSSISKLLYYLYRTVSNYEDFVRIELFANLRDVIRYLDILHQEFSFTLKDRNLRNDFRKEFTTLRRGFRESEYLSDELEKWIKAVESIESIYSDNFKEILDERQRTSRLVLILQDILKTDNSTIELGDSFPILKELIISKFKEAEGKIESRHSSVFINELKSVFSDSVLPKTFEVLEYDSLMVSLDRNNLSIPFTVQNVIYIDTPVVMDVEESSNKHWRDLNVLLTDNGRVNNEFSELIRSEIIHGKAIVEDDDFSADEFKFKRDDGAVFRLLDVATGIKSFSILQLLLNKGILNDKTLLIIDEPESHLHPQWIIEYARIIVLLNKEYGVKFFIASHNPDMVSAIRYISEKQDVLSTLNYYLAEKVGDFSYNYRHLGFEIDPIFESFNIALDRMNQYGIS